MPVAKTGKTEEGIALGTVRFNGSDRDVKLKDRHSDVGCQAGGDVIWRCDFR